MLGCDFVKLEKKNMVLLLRTFGGMDYCLFFETLKKFLISTCSILWINDKFVDSVDVLLQKIFFTSDKLTVVLNPKIEKDKIISDWNGDILSVLFHHQMRDLKIFIDIWASKYDEKLQYFEKGDISTFFYASFRDAIFIYFKVLFFSFFFLLIEFSRVFLKMCL
jgi:hypothetical protein